MIGFQESIQLLSEGNSRSAPDFRNNNRLSKLEDRLDFVLVCYVCISYLGSKSLNFTLGLYDFERICGWMHAHDSINFIVQNFVAHTPFSY